MPIYAYEYTDVAGGTFDAYQHMSEEALTAQDGRPCRRVFTTPRVVVPKSKRKGETKLRGVHRAAKGAGGVYNPRLSNPHVSITLPYDPRDGEINGNVREHKDGTLTTYDPINSANDRRPIVRNEDDRKKFCAHFNATHLKE